MNTAQMLLFDILKIRAQYEDRDFDIVLEALRDKQQDPQLVTVLELARDISELGSKKPVQSSNRKKADQVVEGLFVEAESEPEKHAMLVQIHELVTSTKVFRTKKDLLPFVIRRVSHVKSSETRPVMVQQYLSSLSKLVTSELELELEILKNPKSKQGQEGESSFLRMATRMVEPQKSPTS